MEKTAVSEVFVELTTGGNGFVYLEPEGKKTTNPERHSMYEPWRKYPKARPQARS